MTKIAVVGSSNTDMVVRTKRFPEPGETLIGGDFFMFPGGKGANQAVAAARAGGTVTFVCSVGDDVFGGNALQGYREEGIETGHALVMEETASGVALITVNQEGENEIVVASGANALLTPEHLDKSLAELSDIDLFLAQLEIPLETVRFLAQHCKKNRRKLILNPAPASELDGEILDGLFLITPNESETKSLTGIEVRNESDLQQAGQSLLDRGVQNVIITLGHKGSFFMNAEEYFSVPARKVKAVDTTAAGDVFNGVLAVGLANKLGWRESIAHASKAAALSVTKMGAQGSAPDQNEINRF